MPVNTFASKVRAWPKGFEPEQLEALIVEISAAFALRRTSGCPALAAWLRGC